MRETIAKHLDHDPEFEWRGQNVTRIENLSDIVFALALGMLLLTGTPPQTYSELIAFLIDIVPVTAGFAILVMIWNVHFVFFRRYAIADNYVVVLNCALLLMVLFIAYPLRFIFDGLFGYVVGSISGDFSMLDTNEMGFRNSGRSVAIFAGGYAIIFFLLSLLYRHALRCADVIGLSDAETQLTKRSVWYYRMDVVIGLLVLVLAWFSPLGPFAGGLMIISWPVAIYTRRVFKMPGYAEHK